MAEDSVTEAASAGAVKNGSVYLDCVKYAQDAREKVNVVALLGTTRARGEEAADSRATRPAECKGLVESGRVVAEELDRPRDKLPIVVGLCSGMCEHVQEFGTVSVGCVVGSKIVTESAKTGVEGGLTGGAQGVIGVQAPMGFWEPAGFTNDGDAAAFERRCLIESGYTIPEVSGKLTGYPSSSKDLAPNAFPNGTAANVKAPFPSWLQIMIY